MNTFTINRNSTSFRYLARWNKHYKWFAEDGEINQYGLAHDFCSYYRTVIKQIMAHSFMALFIPAMFYFNIHVWLLGGLPANISYIDVVWVIPFVIMGFMGTVLSFVFLIFLISYFIIENLIKPIWVKIPKKKHYKVHKPGLIKTWYSGFKGKYCPTLEYGASITQRSTTTEK